MKKWKALCYDPLCELHNAKPKTTKKDSKMIELRWTTKKTGLVLQYRTRTLDSRQEAWEWTEWTDVLDVNGDYRVIPALDHLV